MTVTGEYSYVDPFSFIDEKVSSRRRTIGVVWNDDRPIGERFPNTDVPVPADPTICESEPDLWFPERANAAKAIDQAKRYCKHCWMVDECREYGLKHPTTDGIWGGLTRAERQGQARHRTTH